LNESNHHQGLEPKYLVDFRKLIGKKSFLEEFKKKLLRHFRTKFLRESFGSEFGRAHYNWHLKNRMGDILPNTVEKYLE
jgi:hypothetical protein